jgi:hypothetical protein
VPGREESLLLVHASIVTGDFDVFGLNCGEACFYELFCLNVLLEVDLESIVGGLSFDLALHVTR